MNPHLSDEELTKFINNPSEHPEFAAHLNKCVECYYRLVVRIDKLIFERKITESAAEKTKQAVKMATDRTTVAKRKDISRLKIDVRWIEEVILITSDNKEYNSFKEMMSDFEVKGRAGSTSISRPVGKRSITLVFTPTAGEQTLILSANVKPQESLKVKLIVNGTLSESIDDISHHSLFSFPLPPFGNAELIFSDDEEELFAVDLSLQSIH